MTDAVTTEEHAKALVEIVLAEIDTELANEDEARVVREVQQYLNENPRMSAKT